MKEQIKSNKNSIFKKIFVKLCRILGFEIIDQSNFYVPTQEKFLNENLNIQGKKSITIPMGETKISRKVNSLSIIFRSCTSVNMLTQSKKRLFEKNKSEYTFRSLNSIILALNVAKKAFPNIDLDLIVIDHNSQENDVMQIKKQLNKSNYKNVFINLNLGEFENNIKKTNSKNQPLSKNQLSNMCNLHKSFLIAKNQCKDLVYFVEDDYLHHKDSLVEMILSYERLSSQLNQELILCPTDYPYLYTKINSTKIFLGSNKHWRRIEETLCTFLTSKKIIEKHWVNFISMCQFEHYPFEKPLHEIYRSEYCLSPLPSLAIHFTNINSIFGISPNTDLRKIWEENKNY